MKLQGIRVLDLSQFLPGPHLTMMMADHGADVDQGRAANAGEPVRQVGLQQNGHSVWFRNTHRNKRCIALDLKQPTPRRAAFLRVGSAAPTSSSRPFGPASSTAWAPATRAVQAQ